MTSPTRRFLLLALCASGCADPGPSGLTPSRVWEALTPSGPTVRSTLGVSTHMAQRQGDDALRDFEFETYDRLGGSRIREDFLWDQLEPTDDAWNFDAVRGQVDLAREHGTPITAMLAYGVNWAVTDGLTSSIDPAEYAEYAGALAAEYCDDIHDYEIWNEENSGVFWHPQPDPVAYAELLGAAYASIHAACPDARVLFGGILSYDFFRTSERWWFLKDVGVADPALCDHFDVLALHPYTWTQKGSPDNDTWVSDDFTMSGQTAMTGAARDILATLGCEDKPIQFTETGWPSFELSEETQALYLTRGALLALRDGVEAYDWYTFWDGEPITDGLRPHENYFGLYGWTGADGMTRRPKPAFEHMAALADVLGEFRFAADLASTLTLPEDVHVLAFLTDDGTPALAAWDGRDEPDVTPAGVAEGGLDTRIDVELARPSGFRTAEIFDAVGAPVETQTGAVTTLRLTRSPLMVRYHP